MLELVQLSLLIAPALLAPQDRPISQTTPVDCPVTLAVTRPFAEPSPSSAARFWYGSEDLAVLLKAGGTWQGMGPNRRYRDKLFWWRRGYDGRSEPRPNLIVKGRRLDGDAPPADASRATNAHHPDFGGWAMLTAVEFPASGCWELAGQYQGKERASSCWSGRDDQRLGAISLLSRPER